MPTLIVFYNTAHTHTHILPEEEEGTVVVVLEAGRLEAGRLEVGRLEVGQLLGRELQEVGRQGLELVGVQYQPFLFSICAGCKTTKEIDITNIIIIIKRSNLLGHNY